MNPWLAKTSPCEFGISHLINRPQILSQGNYTYEIPRWYAIRRCRRDLSNYRDRGSHYDVIAPLLSLATMPGIRYTEETGQEVGRRCQ
jgi:hypothetical protein